MKKILLFSLLLAFLVMPIFANEITGNVLVDGAVEMVAKKSVPILKGVDWIIAGAVCFVVEVVIKKVFKDETKHKWIWKLSPLVLAVLIELIITLINKGVWYNGLILGVQVGTIAITYYDVILKAFKDSGKEGLDNMSKKIEESVEGK